MRGRKPKPTSQREIEGNAGKRPFNANEPKPPAPEPTFADPPAEIAGNKDAAAEWTRLVPMLMRIRQVTQADRAILISMCQLWARWVEAEEKVKVLGMVVKAGPNAYPIVNPYLGVANKTMSLMRPLWGELGLTPSSRSRLSIEAGEVDANETKNDDAFDKLFLVKGRKKA